MWSMKLLLDCGMQAKDHQKDSAPGCKKSTSKESKMTPAVGSVSRGNCDSAAGQTSLKSRRGKEGERRASRHIALSIAQMLL